MKKRILAGIMVFVLIGGIAAGVTYAVSEHQTMVGDKLVGTGLIMGEGEAGPILFAMLPVFQITNPDCAYSITIERVALLDADGEVLWEGLPGDCPFAEIPDVMDPHEIVTIFIFADESMPEWLPPGWEPPDEEVSGFTLEVEWETDSRGLPLAGVVYEMAISLIGMDGPEMAMLSPAAHPMVNYNQSKYRGGRNGGGGGPYVPINGPYNPFR